MIESTPRPSIPTKLTDTRRCCHAHGGQHEVPEPLLRPSHRIVVVKHHFGAKTK